MDSKRHTFQGFRGVRLIHDRAKVGYKGKSNPLIVRPSYGDFPTASHHVRRPRQGIPTEPLPEPLPEAQPWSKLPLILNPFPKLSIGLNVYNGGTYDLLEKFEELIFESDS